MSEHTTEQIQIHLSRGRDGCELAVRLGAIAIVVDALRASTTIANLFVCGAARVLVIATVEDALALIARYPDALLVGERRGERLPGFHLGNSPQEVMATPGLPGRTVIFTSSNGAQRLVGCLGAAQTLVGTLANATAIAEWTRAHAEAERRPVVFVAAGKFPDEEFISPEDEATCAYLAARTGLPIAPASRETFQHWQREITLRGLEHIFRNSPHARRLMEIGYGDDVVFCAHPDTLPALPMVTTPINLRGRTVGVDVVTREG